MRETNATLLLMNVITHLLLALFTIPALGEGLENLCDIVDPDTGVPTRCELHPDGAPVLDEAVCCNASSCYESEDGWCPDVLQPYQCDLGVVLASKEVRCYVEVPSYCELFPCHPGYQPQPESYMMCCNQGVCWHFNHGDACELDDLFWCGDGVSNEDGTVTCFD